MGSSVISWITGKPPETVHPLNEAQLGQLAGELRAQLQEGTSKREHVNRRLEIAADFFRR